MPVYNGSLHIERALETLRNQRFGDFELIISDNASTDATPTICEKYAHRDPRIVYVRAPVNRGACSNFNRVADLARAEFFVWAAHDDEWHPYFIESCIGVLRREPMAVACYSLYQAIDFLGTPSGGPLGSGCELPLRRARWNHVLRNGSIHPAIYGVMRTGAVRRTRGLRPCLSGDLIFMSELLLQGEVKLVPEPLHRKRLPASGAYRRQDVMRALDPHGGAPWRFYRYGLLLEELAGLRHARLAKSEEEELAADAWRHYLMSRGWLYDGKDGIRGLLSR